ncbi:MAG: selenium-dependent molybdenum cofactor biosynthesis protein YqeB [Chloroflexota bacterium]
MKTMPEILIRGGGDLATGVALRLHRVGFRILITELPQPLVVRRTVAFAEAVYRGQHTVEGVTACLAKDSDQAMQILDAGQIPVLIDPGGESRHYFTPLIIIDARMTKRSPDLGINAAPFTIGLGPGFVAGRNCHAAIETNRGHFLARVIWDGSPQANTKLPEAVDQHQADRVLRSPDKGLFQTFVEIGQHVEAGDLIAEVEGSRILAPFAGRLRGLLHPGLPVHKGMKVGDVDPRDDDRFVVMVSEKALALGGGVLEAILSQENLRTNLWN